MSESSDDEIEIVYNSIEDDDSPLTPEQIRKLEERWPDCTSYTQRTITWMSNAFRIPVQKILRWDEERRERLNAERAQQIVSAPNPAHVEPQPGPSSRITTGQQGEAQPNDFGRLQRMRRYQRRSSIQQARNTMSDLHSVFPRRDHQIRPDDFPGLFRERLMTGALHRLTCSFNLFLFVDCSMNGESAPDRLKSLERVTEKTCIPMFIGSTVDTDPNIIRNRLQRNYELSHWKYLRFYDIYKIRSGNFLLHDVSSAMTAANYRKETVLATIKILASRVVQSQQLPQFQMKFINTSDGCRLLERSINHITNDEAIDAARTTSNNGVSLLCPRLTTARCTNQECPHYIHFDDLELIYEVDKNLQPDDRQGIPIPLYRVQTFNLGEIFLPHHQNPEHYVPRLVRDQERDLQNLRTKLDGYRSIQTDFYVYVAIGVHVEDKTQVPAHLTLEMIRNGLKAYMYVGRSKFYGLPLHNFCNDQTSFAKSVRLNKLNVFWILRNFKCNSFLESEKFEAIYQVMQLHIKKVSQFPNLHCTNIRFEATALDFATDVELQQMFEVIRQPGFRFLYDTRDQVNEEINFGFFESPLILNEGEQCFY